MPADILRDRETDETPKAETPDFGALATAAAPSLDQRIAETERNRDTAFQQREQAGTEEVAARRRLQVGMAPLTEQTKQVVGAPSTPPPPPTVLPAPPSRKLTDFLSVHEGEAPENTISKLIQATTLMATGFTGLARGDATAALASMKGALQGWQEGDKQRADRAFADWKAQTDKLIYDAEERHRYWKDLFEDKKLSVEQQMQLWKLSLESYGFDVAATESATRDADARVKFYTEQQNHLDQVKASSDRLAQMHADRQAAIQATDQRARERREDQRAAAVERELNVRAARDEKREQHLDEPAKGEFYDWSDGSIRQITNREWQADHGARAGGQPPLFTHATNQQVALVERLAIAPRILDRVRELVDKVNAVAPGDNITTGLLNKIAQKAGISAELQELRALNADAALELTAALSGGQPRITILHIIREEATPGVGMTRDAAQRSVDTMETTIRNRLQMTTGDPNAYDKLSKGLKPYAPGQKGKDPLASEGDPLGIRR